VLRHQPNWRRKTTIALTIPCPAFGAFFLELATGEVRGDGAQIFCDTMAAAPRPAAVFDGGMVLAYIAMCNYIDHLPLYRRECGSDFASRLQVAKPKSHPLSAARLATALLLGAALNRRVEEFKKLLVDGVTAH